MRAVPLRLPRAWLEFVYPGIDLLQRIRIGRTEIFAMGDAGNGFERAPRRGRCCRCAEYVLLRGCPDADGVDAQAALAAIFAAAIGSIMPALLPPSVSRIMHHLALFPRGIMVVAQSLHAQPDRIADRRLRSGDADHGSRRKWPTVSRSGGQRRLQIGLRAEQDQADLVALAVTDEIARDLFDDIEARTVAGHVPRRHGTGHIDRKHQLAPCGRHRQRIVQPLRARSGGDQQQPDQAEQRHGRPIGRERRTLAAAETEAANGRNNAPLCEAPAATAGRSARAAAASGTSMARRCVS